MNQCMGCQAGWPIRVRVHRWRPGRRAKVHEVPEGYPHEIVQCTADRYEPDDDEGPERGEWYTEGRW